MTSLQAIFLGVIQGLTEFLPVSSSGHLVIAQTFLGFTHPPVFFDVIVHVGTLTAVLVFFYKRLLKITLDQIKLMVIGTIPAVIAGLIIEPYLEIIFESLWIVVVGLCFTGTILLLTKKLTQLDKPLKKLSLSNAVMIGIFQALAITPGISRSGSTVFAGFLSKLKREDAFYFSFLLSIPAIVGATVLQLKDIQTVSSIKMVPHALGFLAAALTGLVSLKLLELVISQTKLHFFAYYCFSVAFLLSLYQIF